MSFSEVKVPPFGESVTEATVLKWLCNIGDFVAQDAPLVELDSDKITVTVPAPTSGYLREVLKESDETVSVGEVIARIEASAEGEGEGEAGDETAARQASDQATPTSPRANGQAAAAAARAVQPAAAKAAPPVEVVVPPAGESVTEARVEAWLVKEGDHVTQDAELVELETDKVNVTVPAPVSGVLQRILQPEGADVKIGQVLALILPGGDQAAAQADVGSAVASPLASTHVGEGQGDATADPDRVMPAARRLIEERGLDAAQITPTGPRGHILKEDVLNHAAPRAQPRVPRAETGDRPRAPEVAAFSGAIDDAGTTEALEELVPMSRLRQRVAERLVEAQRTAAILTTFNEVDMSAIMALRKRHQDRFVKRYGTKLGFMSFFTKAVVDALKAYPAVNAELRGKDVVYKNYQHIGVAVGGGKGLVVPVIRHAERLGFAEIELEIQRLALLARDNKLTLDHLTGGTFTISNGGVYGSMLSTPILNPPQTGILGMHNIIERPVVVDGKIEARPMMYLALSYDHRLIDGREAVQFLIRVKECVENPERMLLEV